MSTGLASLTSNLPSFKSDPVTSREIVLGTLGTYTWTDTQATNAEIVYYNLPAVLVSNSQIVALKNSYSYFKGKIKFIFRLSSSMFDSGTLYTYYLPYGMTKNDQPNAFSGFNHLLLRTGPTVSGEIDVPFVIDQRFLDTSTIATGDNSMGFLTVRVLAPLRNNSAGATSTATLTVSMKVYDLEFYMPQSGVESNDKARHNSISDAFTHPIDTAASIVSTASSTISQARKIGSTVSAIASFLHKPPSLQRGNIVKIDPYDLNNSHGLYTGQIAALNYENRVSSDPAIYGSDVDEMNFSYIASVPMMLGSTLSITGPAVTRMSMLSADESTTQFVYCDWLAKHFVHYRGSYKFKAYFSSNLNIKMRGVFYIGPPTTPARGEWDNYPHRIVDVVGSTDVEFTVPYIDTHLAIEGNGSDRRLYFECISFDCGSGSTGTAYLHLYKAAGPDMQYSTPINIGFRPQSCPRMDFKKEFDMISPGMSHYRDSGFIDGFPVTHVKEILMKDQPYYYLDGTMVDPAETSIDLIDTVNQVNYYDSPSEAYIGIEKWALLFMYVRGSINVRIINPPEHPAYITTLWPVYIDDSGSSRSLPFYSIASTNNPQAQISVPYVSKRPFTKLWTGSNTTLPYVQTNPCIGDPTTHRRMILKSVGDDFTFGHLRPPPVGNFVTDPGFYNFKAFLRKATLI